MSDIGGERGLQTLKQQSLKGVAEGRHVLLNL